MKDLIDLIRATTRPAITTLLVFTWCYMIVGEIDIPTDLTLLTWGCVVWWFGDRTYFKMRNK